MGFLLSKLSELFEDLGTSEARILMLGLDAAGLVYVVDSADRERMAEARKELFGILESEEMRGVPVCIIANKQDLPNALNPSTVIDHLNLYSLTGRKWYIQAACATTGEGIYEAMQQLALMVKEFKED